MGKRVSDLVYELLNDNPVSLENCGINKLLSTGGKARVNIIALGDVGMNVLLGLKLLGGDVISEIGIYDINESQLKRLEMEFNQMSYPPGIAQEMPDVRIIDENHLSDCDVVVFCATKGVPEIGASGDVRMMQLENNLSLVRNTGEKLKNQGFNGLVSVVSDPVDQLCKGIFKAWGGTPGQVRGFGLGVMAGRAKYYALQDDRFKSYITEGRAYGPHGQDLVIANSIDNYDDKLSRDLTELTVNANMKVRELGYKPYLAPAISSGAIPIILTLKGEWNYGSVYFGTDEEGAYLGIMSRLTKDGIEYEDLELPEGLYERIESAYKGLL